MTPSRPVPPAAAALRDEAVADGLREGADFAIVFVTQRHGAECVLLTGSPDGFLVLYTDRGASVTLASTPVFEEARAVLLEEARWLAAERGRGPYVGRRRPLGTEDRTTEALVAEYDRWVAHRAQDGAQPGRAAPSPRPPG